MQPSHHSRAAWPSGDDNAGFNLIVIVIGVCAGSYLLWTYYHTEISTAIIALRHQEIQLIRHFTDRYDLADQQMRRSNPAGVTLRDLCGVSDAVGRFWRIPGAAFTALLAVLCVVGNAPGRFKRAFDLDGLIGEQARSFPTTAAFQRRRLRLVVPASGDPRPADYALTPAEWLHRYAIGADGGFSEFAARQALLRQLGPRWDGLQSAAPQVRVVFAAFAQHLAERRDEALELLGTCSETLAEQDCHAPEGPSAPLILPDALAHRADAMLGHADDATLAALEIADRHAWTNPALMSLLNAARRRTGVLAPAQFAWLKLMDRPLWYALHSLGYETEDGVGRYQHPNPRAEALGARDHWAVERAVAQPVFIQALDALRRIDTHASSRRRTFPPRTEPTAGVGRENHIPLSPDAGPLGPL